MLNHIGEILLLLKTRGLEADLADTCLYILSNMKSHLSTTVAANIARRALQQMTQNWFTDVTVYVEFNLISKYTV